MNNNNNIIQLEDAPKLTQQLFNLKHCGPFFRQIKDNIKQVKPTTKKQVVCINEKQVKICSSTTLVSAINANTNTVDDDSDKNNDNNTASIIDNSDVSMDEEIDNDSSTLTSMVITNTDTCSATFVTSSTVPISSSTTTDTIVCNNNNNNNENGDVEYDDTKKEVKKIIRIFKKIFL